MSALWFLTDFGDSAIILPLALLVLLVLLAAREWRLALAWAAAIGGCGAVMLALKLAFAACGHPQTPFAVFSPSGHTAMSATVYLSLALLVGVAVRPLARWIIPAAAALLTAGITVSRVALDRHNAAEAAIGLVVGLAAAGGFYAMLRRQPAPLLPIPWLLGGGIAVIVVMHGTRLMIEPAVHSVAGAFRLALPWCR